MKIKATLIVSTCLVFLSACAGQSVQNETTVTSANKEKNICTKEKKTGSNVTRTVCRTPEQVEADRRDAKEMAYKRQHGN